MFNKKHSSCIKPLVAYKHDRVSVLKISATIGDIVLINAYMPFFNTRDIQNQRIIYQDTLAYIENVIQDHLACQVVILMDMNCNLYNTSHPYSVLINDLMTNNNLSSAFDTMPEFNHTTDYTRCDLKTGSFTLIDGILLSSSLLPFVSNVSISDYGNNVSDHRPVEMDLNIVLKEIPLKEYKFYPTVNWKKMSLESSSIYRAKMTEKLDSISIPFNFLLHGDKCCHDPTHSVLIQSYYNDIVDAILSADTFLPRANPAIHKPYWSPTLTDLKNQSMECCNRWRSLGAPRSGPIFDCKRNCCLRYKHAIKNAKREYDQSMSDALLEDLESRDFESFWRNWRNRTKSSDSLVTRVDGEVTQTGIAEAFGNHFQGVYSDNNTPAHESLKTEFFRRFNDYYNSHIADSIGPNYLSWSDMTNVMSKVKTGKSSSGLIRPEHILFGSEKLVYHLHLLFNSMLQHGVVPIDFLKGTITPIVKDNQGDVSSCTNYRGITLGNLLSKLFEYAIDSKIVNFLNSDLLQFGFKSRTSTSHALYALKSVTSYFNARGSDVFTVFLDCKKAFDRISHYGLLTKLMERKVPLCLIILIMFWLLHMTCKVKWGEEYSGEFPVPLGTKQGAFLLLDSFQFISMI